MPKFANKLYTWLSKKYPDAFYIYNLYKENNSDFHKKHKLTSRRFLTKLIALSKNHSDLSKTAFPKGAFNPLLCMTTAAENPEPLDSCFAIPDSKLLQRESPEELARRLSKYDAISFDIFDTCIFRPFQNPTDLYYLLESQNGIINFSEFRIKAERQAREKTSKPNFEVDIYDIYEELSHICPVKREDAEKEIQAELDICYANPYMLSLFNLLKKQHKKLIAISDMYLPSSVIRAILEKNGFVGFSKIYVSNECGFNKNSGMLFNIAKEDSQIDYLAHIGDSQEADVIGAQTAGVDSYYYQQCNAFGAPFRPLSLNPVMSVYNGILNNYLYNGTASNTAREDFGLIYAGIAVVGYLEWINQFVKTNGLDKILFFARDMDIFYKEYNKHFYEYPNAYVVTSRFSLQQFLIYEFPDEVLVNIIDVRKNRGYTIKRTFLELDFPFLLPFLKEYGLHENSFVNDNNIKKIYDLIKAHLDLIKEHYRDNEEAAKMYFKEMIGDAKKLCLVDLGWRGSIHYYLKYLLVEKWKLCEEVKGVLFGASLSTAAAALISKGLVTVFAFDTLHNREFLRPPMTLEAHTFVCSMESIFTSEEASLIEFRLNKETNSVEFAKLGDNPNKKITRELHKGISRFIELFQAFRDKYKGIYPISSVDAFDPLNNIFHNWDYISRIVGDVLDTPYQVAGFNLEQEKFVPIGELMASAHLIEKWPLEG